MSRDPRGLGLVASARHLEKEAALKMKLGLGRALQVKWSVVPSVEPFSILTAVIANNLGRIQGFGHRLLIVVEDVSFDGLDDIDDYVARLKAFLARWVDLSLVDVVRQSGIGSTYGCVDRYDLFSSPVLAALMNHPREVLALPGDVLERRDRLRLAMLRGIDSLLCGIDFEVASRSRSLDALVASEVQRYCGFSPQSSLVVPFDADGLVDLVRITESADKMMMQLMELHAGLLWEVAVWLSCVSVDEFSKWQDGGCRVAHVQKLQLAQSIVASIKGVESAWEASKVYLSSHRVKSSRSESMTYQGVLGKSLCEHLVYSGLCRSREDVMDQIEAGAVKVNGLRMLPDFKLTDGNYTVEVGKRRAQFYLYESLGEK
ncbi:hypothetical protein ACP3V3_01945 [Vibrio sp. PNB22_3_1]